MLFDMDYVIFRPHNVYGERQNIGDKYRNVVGSFINQIMQVQSMIVFCDGEQYYTVSYIGELASLAANAIDNPEAYNQVFNLGADQPYTVNELDLSVARPMNVEPNPIHFPTRNKIVRSYSSQER